MELFLQILGLAYFIFAMCRLRWAVLLLPLFFPTYLLKFDVAGVPFPLVEVFIYATFLAWLIRTFGLLLRRKISWKEIVAPFKNGLWLAVLGLIVAAVIGVVIAPQAVTMMDGNTIFYGRKIALGILKSWIIAPVLMLMLFAWVMRTAKDKALAMSAYTISAVFLASWGVYQTLTQQYFTPDMRASGPFNSANYLALYITPALFYSLVRLKNYVVVEHESWWKKIFHFLKHDTDDRRARIFLVLTWSAAFVLLFFGLLFTKSYAALLAFALVAFVWIALQTMSFRTVKKFPWKIFWIFLVAVLMIAAAVIFLDPVKWQTFFQLSTRSSSGVRVEVYTVASQLAIMHPLQGIGLGMFPAVYQLEGPRILGHQLYELNMLHPHNVFLAFWLNLGLLGLVSFLWILKACVQRAWGWLKNLRQLSLSNVEWFRAIGLLMLFIIVVHGLVDTPFFKNDLSLLFWLVVSVIMFP